MATRAAGAASAEFIEPIGTEETATPPAEIGEGAELETEEAEGVEELHVAFGADPSPGSESDDEEIEVNGVKHPAPPWVKNLREEARVSSARMKELEAENTRLKNPEPAAAALVVVGEFPTLEGCGFDEAKFQAESRAWYERQRKADAQTEELKAKEETKKKAEQDRSAAYLKERASIKASDVDVIEKVALDKLSILQQNLILAGIQKPALFVYALGKPQSAAKLAELSAITDPVKFVAAAARLETELKTKMAKPGIKPEGKLSGNASTTATGDKKLEMLRAEAERTGNYTAVRKYKTEMKRKAASG